MIKEVFDQLLTYYKTLPYKELRRRQELCHLQLERARETKKLTAVLRLQTMDTALMYAILYVTGEK
jgi:hypothetical protein